MLPLPKDPVTETGLSELAIGVPLERKVMMPAGGKAALLVLTVAVNKTGSPWITLLLLATRPTVVGALVTVMGTAAETLGVKPASPP